MVEDFAEQCRAADYKLTVYGSWMEDRLRMPGFWNDIYTKWQIDASQEQIVEATLALVQSDG